MAWIILNVLITLAAAAWTLLVLFANAMSDAPSQPFQGDFSVLAAWGIVVGAWALFAIG